jgi:hypothetical protein
MHVFTVFAPYSPSYSLSPPSSPFHWYHHTHTLGRTCSALLFSDFVKEKRKIFLLI